MEKLPEDFKAKWVAALRSGEYEQGRSALYEDGCYCCIGVLGRALGVSNDAMDGYYSREISNVISDLPELLKTQGFGKIPDATMQLMRMNDNDGKTFLEIADYIEQNL